MESGATLLPLTAADLGLPTGHDRVAGFEVPGPPGTATVPAAALAEAMDGLAPEVDLVVFVTAGRPDLRGDDDPVVRLVERFDRGDAAVVIDRVPATDAVKRIEGDGGDDGDGDRVVGSVDRATLNVLRTPEVIDRRALQEALATVGAGSADPDLAAPAGPAAPADPIDPAVLVARAGGRVVVDGL